METEFNPHKLHRREDPETSVDSAHKAKLISRLHNNLIILALEDRDGTAEEIGIRCNLTDVQVSRRLKSLEDNGEVERTAERRKKRSGRTAIVWKRI